MSTPKRTIRSVFEHDTWVKPYFSRYRPQLLRAIGLGLITYLFAMLLMFVAGYLICRTAEEQNGILMVMLPIILVQIFGIGKPITRYLERLVSHDWVFRMTSSLRKRLYSVVEASAIKMRRTHQIGDFLGLIAEDIGHIQNLYLRTIFPLVIAWLACAAVVVALGFVSLPYAVFVLAVLGAAVLALPLASIAANRARMERQKAAKNQLYTQLADNVLGAGDWIFAGRGQEYLQRYEASQEALRADQHALNRYARINDSVAMVLFGIAALVTLLWAGSHFGGQMAGPSNWIAAFVLAVFPLIEVFMPLPMAATQAYTHIDAIERLNNLGESPIEDIQVDEDEPSSLFSQALDGAQTMNYEVDESAYDFSFETSEDEYHAHDATNTHVQLPDSSSIDINDVHFTYDDGTKPVLDGVTLHIEEGSKVAILGRSGSGKTTLAQLVRGDLAPTSGSITIGGVACASIAEDIYRKVGVVSQQAYLFNRTLRDNLTLGNKDIPDEDIWNALEAVELFDMVQQLPKKLDTVVDESGSRFSGGERHRIALARVLLAKVDVVILDEPTVGLDPETEAGLLKTLFEVLEGKTLLMITHHLQGATHFDRIIFLENGQITMDGSPAELEKTNAHYCRLLNFDRGIETGNETI